MTGIVDPLVTIFNNRELALLVWCFPLLFFILYVQDIRKSLIQVLKTATSFYIVTFCLSIFAYSILEVYALRKIGIWTEADIKDTTVWLLFSGIIVSFNSLTKMNDKGTLLKIVKDTFKFIIVFEFVVNLYTFSFWKEILLVPFVTFVVILKEVAKLNPEHKIVEKVFSWVEVFIGLFLIGYSIDQIIENSDTFFSIETARQIILTPMLTVLLIPFIYFWLVYAIYENIFVRLKMGPKKDKGLIFYSKIQVFRKLGLSLPKLREFSTSKAVRLIHISKREDVDQVLNQ